MVGYQQKCNELITDIDVVLMKVALMINNQKWRDIFQGVTYDADLDIMSLDALDR